jgi:hypothetical protein
MLSEHVKTLEHFVHKATKWNEGANEYANETGVYAALDALRDKTRSLEATPARGVVLDRWLALVSRDGDLVRFVRSGESEVVEKRDAQVPTDAPHRVVRVALVSEGTPDAA